MQKLEIKKGVPIPTSHRKTSRSRYGATIDQMEIGDMFEESCNDKNVKRLYNAIWSAFASRGYKCTIIRLDKNKLGVWRISKQAKRNEKLKENES